MFHAVLEFNCSVYGGGIAWQKNSKCKDIEKKSIFTAWDGNNMWRMYQRETDEKLHGQCEGGLV